MASAGVETLSMESKTAKRAALGVRQRVRAISSQSKVAKKLSAMALS